MNMPIVILNQNAKRQKGRKAQLGIIAASKAVSDIVRTTLGPRAMLKMLLDPNGGVVLTNDGASILREIEVQHPAAKTIIELSRTQDERVGDGTTSVVVLAGELMSVARPFISEGMHPSRLVTSYRQAADDCLEKLGKLARTIDTCDRSKLLEIASKTLDTKFVSRFGSLVPSLAIDAVTTIAVGEKENVVADVKNLVKVEKVPGGEITQSKVLKGVMINKDILHSAMRRTVSKPRIMILDCPLEYKKAESETNIEMTKSTDWKRYLDIEEDYIRTLCSQIRSLSPDVVITEKGVSDMAQHFLLQSNISVIRRVRKSDLHRLALATGATVSSQPDKMVEKDIGKKCASFEVRKIGDEYWSFFEDCQDAKACSVLLRGASKDILSEVERNLIDAMGTVKNLLIEPKVVPGGGASEMAMATHLRQRTGLLGKGVEIKPYLSVAKALEVIPKTLVENCGGNVSSVLAELRDMHEVGTVKAETKKMKKMKRGAEKNKEDEIKDNDMGEKDKEDSQGVFGVNGKTGKVVDMEDYGVWEPLVVKKMTVKTAFEAAMVLLKIDDILSGVSKGKGAGPSPGPQQEEGE